VQAIKHKGYITKTLLRKPFKQNWIECSYYEYNYSSQRLVKYRTAT
jgi:hypothetical protein